MPVISATNEPRPAEGPSALIGGGRAGQFAESPQRGPSGSFESLSLERHWTGEFAESPQGGVSGSFEIHGLERKTAPRRAAKRGYRCQFNGLLVRGRPA